MRPSCGETQVMSHQADIREDQVKRGRRLEYFTIFYNSLEGLISIIAGLFAGSVSLIGFGVDSVIEVTSGTALLWRLHHDTNPIKRESAERTTLRIVGLCFYRSGGLHRVRLRIHLDPARGSGPEYSGYCACRGFPGHNALAGECQKTGCRHDRQRRIAGRFAPDRLVHLSVSHSAMRSAAECTLRVVVGRPGRSPGDGPDHRQ